MNAHSRTQPFVTQLFDLTLIQLANWRWSWRGMLITSLVAPLFGIAGLSVFARDTDPGTLGYILTGNMVMSLLFGTFDKVAAHFAYMRIVGRLAFFATLPIYRAVLILATVLAFLVLALPAALITLLSGMLILNISLHPSPWLIVTIPLIGVTMCGLGALIGIIVRTPEEVGNLSALITFLLVGFGPVILPLDRWPSIIRTLSYLSPATYAASALRQTILGMPDRIPLGIDLIVLTALWGGSLWIVGRRMDWRQT
ncbi:MAG: ABC transporter permease [Chloroflexi bacterium]|nr:ABC transporter permease [Chloroflexota bacterium]